MALPGTNQHRHEETLLAHLAETMGDGSLICVELV